MINVPPTIAMAAVQLVRHYPSPDPPSRSDSLKFEDWSYGCLVQ